MERVKITTTIRADLWKRLQITALTTGCGANDILEVLIERNLGSAPMESLGKSRNLTAIIKAVHAGSVKSSKKGGK